MRAAADADAAVARELVKVLAVVQLSGGAPAALRDARILADAIAAEGVLTDKPSLKARGLGEGGVWVRVRCGAC